MKSKYLTEKELKAIDLTSQLWNTLLEIEMEHIMNLDDIDEHRRNVHDIQSRIMSRVLVRLEPDNFFRLSKKSQTYEAQND